MQAYWTRLSVVLWVLVLAAMTAGRVLGPSLFVFGLAYFFLAAAFILGLVVCVPFSASRKQFPTRKTCRHRAEFAVRWWWLLGLTALCFVSILGLQHIWSQGSRTGYLFPSHDDLPPSTCGVIPQKRIALYLGNLVSLLPVNYFPHPVLSVNEVNRIVLKRRWDGAMAVSAVLFDIEGTRIGEVSDNKLVSGPGDSVRFDARDRSTLAVKDRRGLELLRIRYLNSSAMQLEAFVFYPDTGPIQIKGDPAQAPCLRADDNHAEFRIHVAKTMAP